MSSTKQTQQTPNHSDEEVSATDSTQYTPTKSAPVPVSEPVRRPYKKPSRAHFDPSQYPGSPTLYTYPPSYTVVPETPLRTGPVVERVAVSSFITPDGINRLNCSAFAKAMVRHGVRNARETKEAREVREQLEREAEEEKRAEEEDHRRGDRKRRAMVPRQVPDVGGLGGGGSRYFERIGAGVGFKRRAHENARKGLDFDNIPPETRLALETDSDEYGVVGVQVKGGVTKTAGGERKSKSSHTLQIGAMTRMLKLSMTRIKEVAEMCKEIKSPLTEAENQKLETARITALDAGLNIKSVIDLFSAMD